MAGIVLLQTGREEENKHWFHWHQQAIFTLPEMSVSNDWSQGNGLGTKIYWSGQRRHV